MIYLEIANLLRADAELQALIGDRVNFMDAPASGDYPDIIQYVSGGGQGTEHLDGIDGPWSVRISIECRAKTYGGAKGAHAVGEHVRRILNNLVGTFGSENIQLCRQVSDVPLNDDTSAIKRRVIDFRLIYSRA